MRIATRLGRARRPLGADGLPEGSLDGSASAGSHAGESAPADRGSSPEQGAARDARTQAFKRLSRRESSRQDLILWLRGRGFDDSVAESCADELQADGILSDDRFCEAVVHRQLREGRGPRHIESLLRRSGISESTLARWLDSDESVWLERLRAQVERLGLMSLPAWPDRAKAGERLVRRGYPRSWVSRALDLDTEATVDD